MTDTEVLRRVELNVVYAYYDNNGNRIELTEDCVLSDAERWCEENGGLGVAKQYRSEWMHV